MAVVVLRYDLRRAPFSPVSHEVLYRTCLEQCVWADRLGIPTAVVSEHHGVDDGYLPAPLTMAAAILGATERIGVNVAALLLPLHDPVRLAEQMAVLQLLGRGRVSYVLGLGYRPEEFEMAGLDRSQRARRFEDCFRVLRACLRGETVEWQGRKVRVTPVPPELPPMLVGGSTPAAARRAARLGCGFFPAIGDPSLAATYEEECRKVGFSGGFVMLPRGPGFVHVAEDPDAAWERVGPYALYDARSYADWQTPDQRSSVYVDAKSVEDVQRSGVYRILRPEECVELARETDHVVLHPLLAGMPPEWGWESLRLFEEKVWPAIRG
ncbi:MAG: hypothetical protein KatS3mg076_0589 [Candidatus Binatia bacterium]|nr:MAG: hypothetical protein KatS3mg076_0589 [Candidatus Binatia bacterium]